MTPKQFTKDQQFEVRLRNRRGQEIAKALETGILPIKSSRGQPVKEFIKRADGEHWCYIADITRLNSRQLTNMARSLAKKYDDMPVGSVPIEWCDTNSVLRIIKQHGFTVQVEDCVVIHHETKAQQSSFLDHTAPVD